MKERNLVSELIKDTYIPKMFTVKQNFADDHIERDIIPETIYRELSDDYFTSRIKPGMEIAVTCGSRGISNIDMIVKSVCDFVRKGGAVPFVVPAMGSHGGATADGQKEVLAHYGVTEEFLGCEIRSSMETVFVGKNDEGLDVFMDKNAHDADGIIILNRVKPHTSFKGDVESGLMKMMAIGLGKQYGADRCHEAGFRNMAKNVKLFGKTVLNNSPVLFGVAILENAFDKTRRICAVKKEDIMEKEPEFLKEAGEFMPRILPQSCDVLIIDRIGKDISGTGADPNVAGPFGDSGEQYGVKSQSICILDLTENTNGNGYGIGAADATTQRLFDKLDLEAMYVNSITSTALWKNRIPLIMKNDREAIQVAIKCCNEIDKKNPRVIRIHDTLHLSEIMLSESYLDEIGMIPEIERISVPEYLPFNEKGDLL
ncbi:MAG: DUF362 domain-containing protein [Lachnospiraceae bacterium]|nr:DUF362 domain-containing protein [Lachnospiraceae bacterium]